MCREDWMIMAMVLAVATWFGLLLLPSLSSSSPPTVLAIPPCTPACGAVAGVTNCVNQGGSGDCGDTTSGCIHMPPAPLPSHDLAVVKDYDPEPCMCPTNTNKIWLQWKRMRVYDCTLHCKSHVFSDTKVHDPKFRYDQICP